MSTDAHRIGRYLVREIIGVGGFATVYRAADERLGVDVALKVLAENHSLDPELRERFIEEGRRLRRVRSPQLVTVYDLDETERAQPYLVLEWADRGDLAARVAESRRRGRPPAPGDAWAVARSVAAALHQLHARQLVHRDLAPKNLLLASGAAVPTAAATAGCPAPPDGPVGLLAADERVMLADLGLSKDLAIASGVTVAAGTSGFAPPEQREHGGAVDCRADVWAASALIVWLAIGRAPDDTGRWRDELRALQWPTALSGVLDRGLATQPADRHPGIDGWMRALDDALRPAPTRPPRRHDGANPVGRRFLRRPLVAASAVAAVAVAAAVGVLGWRLHDRGPQAHSAQLADGVLATSVEDHGMTIVVEGPGGVEVGERVRLSATISGTDTWTWIGPDGVVLPGASTFEVVARTPGRATVRLLAADDQGHVVEAAHRLQVT